LREAVEKIERSKPVKKVLGWSQRIEIKVVPVPKEQSRMDNKSTETDEPEVRIDRPTELVVEPIRPAPKTTR
jgi:hypothetical protein